MIDIIFLIILALLGIAVLIYSILSLRVEPAELYTNKGPTGPKGPIGPIGRTGDAGPPGIPYPTEGDGIIISEYVYNPYYLSPLYYINNYPNSAAIYQMVNVRQLFSSSTWSVSPFAFIKTTIRHDFFPIYGIINTNINNASSGSGSNKNISQILYTGDFQFARWYEGTGIDNTWQSWYNVIN